MIIFLLLFPLLAFGFDDSPPCLRELQAEFFPPEVVRQAFDMYYVFQSQWGPILLEIRRGTSVSNLRLRERARKMKPNPLQHPFDPEKTRELLLEIQFEIFQSALIKNYFNNVEAIQGMFNFIVNAQGKRLEACFGHSR